MIRRLPLPTAVMCLALSVIVVAFWVAGPDWTLTYLSPRMKPNTALGLALCSLALLLTARLGENPRVEKVGRILAALAMLLGALTLSQYFWRDLGIDQILRLDLPVGENLPYPGRMAPNAAALFVLLGAALCWRDVATKTGIFISDYLLLAVALCSGGAIIGYLYQFSPLFQVSSFLRISQYTAGIFLLLSGAAAVSRPNHRPVRLFLSAGPEGTLARRLLPTSVIVPIFLCWLVSRLRDLEVINRPTGFASLAISLIAVFASLIWWSVRALHYSEKRRREFFEAELRTLSTINQVGQTLVAEHNLEKIVQSVTDAATSLTHAQFGAFFYNRVQADGKDYLLHTISGVPREKFASFPNPRATEVFYPTFMGLGTVRSDDITRDARYGKTEPHYGMPTGHLPVRSYLAVSVISRTGSVLGGLFFGHEQAGVFTEQAEKIVEGLAAQTAIAMDNAKLYEELQNSVRARDEFLSIASHELRTPLTTLKLQAQTRQRQVARGRLEQFSPENLVRMAATDTRQIDRLARLVDDMLDIGRINTGKLRLNAERFDLSELAREVAERLRPEFQAAGSALDFLDGSELPIEADRDRMEQVIVNLLTNALKYGAKKPVDLIAACENGKALLMVRDRGIGIAPENQERIFERFERAVTASEISGLGLGLFIVRRILNLHNGDISVVSQPGLGSTFTVELPLVAEL